MIEAKRNPDHIAMTSDSTHTVFLSPSGDSVMTSDGNTTTRPTATKKRTSPSTPIVDRLALASCSTTPLRQSNPSRTCPRRAQDRPVHSSRDGGFFSFQRAGMAGDPEGANVTRAPMGVLATVHRSGNGHGWAVIGDDAGAVIVEPGTSAGGGRRSRWEIWGTFGTATALVFSQATSAIALLFLARRTEPEAFGSYIGLYGAALSVGALVDFGSSQYRTRELAKGHERANFRWWLRRRSVMQLPVVVVFGLIAAALIGDRLPMLCTVGLVAQALTYSASQGSMSAVRATRSPVMAEWFVGIGNLVLLVVCVVGPSSVLLVAAGLGAAGSWLLTTIIGLVVTRHLVGGAAPPPELRNPWGGSTSFGVSSFVTSIGGFAIAAIVWTSGADQAALIGAVNKWGQPIVLFAAAYAAYMFPAFARASTDRAAFQLLRPLRVIVGLGTLLAVALMLISPWLVDTLLGEAYAGAETILRLTLLAAIPVLVSQPLTSFLQARGEERFVARLFVGISVTVFPLSIAGSVVLGAASIPLFSILASSILLVVFGRRALALRGNA